MSSIDLFILGWFIRPVLPGPAESRAPTEWTPYGLARFMEENDLKEMVKISTQAVYKNLGVLKRAGFLEEAGKKGGGTAARLLKITPSGKARFRELMETPLPEDIHYRLEMNAFLVNLDKLPGAVALERLSALEAALVKKGEFLEASEERFSFIPMPGRAVIRQNVMLNRTMVSWIREFRESYERECANARRKP
jgi:DNA-binding PadR family transcriptional regulator